MIFFYGSLIDPGSPMAVSIADLSEQTGKGVEDAYFFLRIGVEYGLGIEKRFWAGQEVWGHPGSTMAYATSSWVDPAARATVTTCVTRNLRVGATDADLRHPRAQLFAMSLATAYALADAGVDG
jgi:D-alanyl-D-alanine carboxypeptidase